MIEILHEHKNMDKKIFYFKNVSSKTVMCCRVGLKHKQIPCKKQTEVNNLPYLMRVLYISNISFI